MNSSTQTDQVAPHKGYEIIVNTRPKTVESEYLNYEEVVALAFEPDPPPGGDGVVITVKYRQGPRGSKGSLVRGQETKIADGMIFTARVTDES